jgi:hypothetical protein
MKSLGIGITTASLFLLATTAWSQRDYILQEDNGRIILVPKTRHQKAAEKKAMAAASESRAGGDLPLSGTFQSPKPTASGVATRPPFPSLKTKSPQLTQSGGTTRPRDVRLSNPEETLTQAQGMNYPNELNATLEGVSIQIVSPKPDEILMSDEALVFVRVSSYPISPTAFRIKAILDNETPQTLTNIQKPFIFSNLSQGSHFIRVYLVKPNGRVVDDPGAFAMHRFYIGRKDSNNPINNLSPLLTVNDPVNGRIPIDSQGLFWFDFLTRNAPIGEGAFGVRYRFNNVTSTVYTPKPIFWRGLRQGRYQFTAELIDPDGALVPGPFNRVQREFEIIPNQDPASIEVTRENQIMQHSSSSTSPPSEPQELEDPDLPPAP